MSTFFRKPVVKAFSAILCILFLSVGIFCGILTLNLASAGGFSRSDALYESSRHSMLYQDAHDIMSNYFDPEDPTHPWESYYRGGIYTGEQTNFLYEIRERDQDKVLLGSLGGQDAVFQEDFPFSFTVEETAVDSEIPTLSSDLFLCQGRYYLYEEETDCFSPLSTHLAEYLGNATELSGSVFDSGLMYRGKFFFYAEPNFIPTDGAVEISETHSKTFVISTYLRNGLPEEDDYRIIYHLSRDLSYYRYELLGGTVIGLSLALILLVVLCCTAAKVPGQEAPVLTVLHKIPGDLILAAAIFFLCLGVSMPSIYDGTEPWFVFLIDSFVLLVCSAFFIYLIVSFCARVKTQTLLQSTICAWLLKKCKGAWTHIKDAVIAFLTHFPLIWKVMISYGALCVVELIALGLFFRGDGFLYFLWLMEKLLVGGLVAYVSVSFLRLKNGAENIAAGNYDTQVDTRYLVLDFKNTADTLNHIQDGMNVAVESRMKSEHLKTELITNVSHDLKTPLTSIVSYVDLLKQEPAGSQAAGEYLEVLDRQSARLKKLVEDLVEASKASTGNIVVQREPLDFQMLLGQALGEYSERLQNAGLTPVLKLPDAPVMISADGRYLWRILDNLLNNTVKYAMPGTRFYVTLTADTHAIATFRNISKDELDVSPDELMERFVRGDSSRHTEGSGLGLSIAKSLTESMGGEFVLAVDGDLFKAAVIFPIIPPESPVTPSQLPQEPPQAPEA